jgi:hypothetical protein
VLLVSAPRNAICVFMGHAIACQFAPPTFSAAPQRRGEICGLIAAIILCRKRDQMPCLRLVVVRAARSNAVCSKGGNDRPLFSARRRMPEQAFALKKYRAGRSPVSKISDNEDATAALWNSEVLSVKHSVGEPIPEFDQRPEEGSKIPSFVRRQYAGNVFPDDPARLCSVNKAKIFEGQVATSVCQSFAQTGDAERLAGGSSDKKVNWSIFVSLDGGEVAMQGDVRIMMLKNRSWKLLYFAEESGGPSQRMPRDCRCFYPTAN